MSPNEQLERLSKEASSQIDILKRRLLRIAIARFSCILIGVAIMYFAWGFTALVWIAFGLMMAVFLTLVKRHAAIATLLKIEKEMLKNCQSELKFLSGDWRDKYSGAEFMDADHPYANDLNVFGQHSLFQFLDRTKTKYGKHLFANELKTLDTNPATILQSREALSELSEDPEFLLRLISKATFLDVDPEYFTRLEAWLSTEQTQFSKLKWSLYLIGVPIVVFAATTAYIFDFITGNMLMLSFLLPGLLTMVGLKKHQQHFGAIAKMLSHVDAFESILESIRKKEFNSDTNKKRVADAKLENSLAGIGALKKVVGAMENRNNMLISILLNIYLMWDFRCAKRFDDWKEEYGSDLISWLKLALAFESQVPLGLFVFNHPNYTHAELTPEDQFELIGARHILMDINAVPNSLSLSDPLSFSIITGANMAGKSTFLRTVGSSVILASKGAPVFAESFKFKPKALFTSMLAADSLGDNESYFFNELKRLKGLVTRLERGEEQFVILDEILKGTNSVDKAEGSRKFLMKLLKLPAKGLVATHDLSLCDLANEYPQRLINNKFEVGYDNDELVFAYKLEHGVCQNMNANFLLKKMGLIEA